MSSDGCCGVCWLLLPLLLMVPLLAPLLMAAFNACAAASRFGAVGCTAAVSSASAGATPVVLATKVTAQSVSAVVHFFRFKGVTSFHCEG